MSLSSRKEKILQAIVDDYIGTAIPISSNEIQKNHMSSLSSATIRNELAALEEMGYLSQPHASSGRVPTAEAYKVYIERLMPRKKLTRGELKIIKNYFGSQVGEIKDILTRTAKVITEITKLTSVAMVKNANQAIIHSIKLVKVAPKRALVVINTDMGVLKDATMDMPEDYAEEYYNSASDLITETFSGHSIKEISENKNIINDVIKDYKNFFEAVLEVLKKYADDKSGNEIVLEGSSKILDQPEYGTVKKAKAMLDVLDDKEQLIPILKNDDDMNLHIKINNDDHLNSDPEYAIITASYSIGGKNIGNAGVIGPVRMDYPKVISVLDYIGKTINMLPDSAISGRKAKDGDEEK